MGRAHYLQSIVDRFQRVIGRKLSANESTEPTTPDDKIPLLWIDPIPVVESAEQFWRNQGVLPAESEDEAEDGEDGEEEDEG